MIDLNASLPQALDAYTMGGGKPNKIKSARKISEVGLSVLASGSMGVPQRRGSSRWFRELPDDILFLHLQAGGVINDCFEIIDEKSLKPLPELGEETLKALDELYASELIFPFPDYQIRIRYGELLEDLINRCGNVRSIKLCGSRAVQILGARWYSQVLLQLMPSLDKVIKWLDLKHIDRNFSDIDTNIEASEGAAVQDAFVAKIIQKHFDLNYGGYLPLPSVKAKNLVCREGYVSGHAFSIYHPTFELKQTDERTSDVIRDSWRIVVGTDHLNREHDFTIMYKMKKSTERIASQNMRLELMPQKNLVKGNYQAALDKVGKLVRWVNLGDANRVDWAYHWWYMANQGLCVTPEAEKILHKKAVDYCMAYPAFAVKVIEILRGPIDKQKTKDPSIVFAYIFLACSDLLSHSISSDIISEVWDGLKKKCTGEIMPPLNTFKEYLLDHPADHELMGAVLHLISFQYTLLRPDCKKHLPYSVYERGPAKGRVLQLRIGNCAFVFSCDPCKSLDVLLKNSKSLPELALIFEAWTPSSHYIFDPMAGDLKTGKIEYAQLLQRAVACIESGEISLLRWGYSLILAFTDQRMDSEFLLQALIWLPDVCAREGREEVRKELLKSVAACFDGKGLFEIASFLREVEAGGVQDKQYVRVLLSTASPIAWQAAVELGIVRHSFIQIGDIDRLAKNNKESALYVARCLRAKSKEQIAWRPCLVALGKLLIVSGKTCRDSYLADFYALIALMQGDVYFDGHLLHWIGHCIDQDKIDQAFHLAAMGLDAKILSSEVLAKGVHLFMNPHEVLPDASSLAFLHEAYQRDQNALLLPVYFALFIATAVKSSTFGHASWEKECLQWLLCAKTSDQAVKTLHRFVQSQIVHSSEGAASTWLTYCTHILETQGAYYAVEAWHQGDAFRISVYAPIEEHARFLRGLIAKLYRTNRNETPALIQHMQQKLQKESRSVPVSQLQILINQQKEEEEFALIEQEFSLASVKVSVERVLQRSDLTKETTLVRKKRCLQMWLPQLPALDAVRFLKGLKLAQLYKVGSSEYTQLCLDCTLLGHKPAKDRAVLMLFILQILFDSSAEVFILQDALNVVRVFIAFLNDEPHAGAQISPEFGAWVSKHQESLFGSAARSKNREDVLSLMVGLSKYGVIASWSPFVVQAIFYALETTDTNSPRYRMILQEAGSILHLLKGSLPSRLISPCVALISSLLHNQLTEKAAVLVNKVLKETDGVCVRELPFWISRFAVPEYSEQAWQCLFAFHKHTPGADEKTAELFTTVPLPNNGEMLLKSAQLLLELVPKYSRIDCLQMVEALIKHKSKSGLSYALKLLNAAGYTRYALWSSLISAALIVEHVELKLAVWEASRGLLERPELLSNTESALEYCEFEANVIRLLGQLYGNKHDAAIGEQLVLRGRSLKNTSDLVSQSIAFQHLLFVRLDKSIRGFFGHYPMSMPHPDLISTWGELCLFWLENEQTHNGRDFWTVSVNFIHLTSQSKKSKELLTLIIFFNSLLDKVAAGSEHEAKLVSLLVDVLKTSMDWDENTNSVLIKRLIGSMVLLYNKLSRDKASLSHRDLFVELLAIHLTRHPCEKIFKKAVALVIQTMKLVDSHSSKRPLKISQDAYFKFCQKVLYCASTSTSFLSFAEDLLSLVATKNLIDVMTLSELNGEWMRITLKNYFNSPLGVVSVADQLKSLLQNITDSYFTLRNENNDSLYIDPDSVIKNCPRFTQMLDIQEVNTKVQASKINAHQILLVAFNSYVKYHILLNYEHTGLIDMDALIADLDTILAKAIANSSSLALIRLDTQHNSSFNHYKFLIKSLLNINPDNNNCKLILVFFIWFHLREIISRYPDKFSEITVLIDGFIFSDHLIRPCLISIHSQLVSTLIRAAEPVFYQHGPAFFVKAQLFSERTLEPKRGVQGPALIQIAVDLINRLVKSNNYGLFLRGLDIFIQHKEKFSAAQKNEALYFSLCRNICVALNDKQVDTWATSFMTMQATVELLNMLQEKIELHLPHVITIWKDLNKLQRKALHFSPPPDHTIPDSNGFLFDCFIDCMEWGKDKRLIKSGSEDMNECLEGAAGSAVNWLCSFVLPSSCLCDRDVAEQQKALTLAFKKLHKMHHVIGFIHSEEWMKAFYTMWTHFDDVAHTFILSIPGESPLDKSCNLFIGALESLNLCHMGDVYKGREKEFFRRVQRWLPVAPLYLSRTTDESQKVKIMINIFESVDLYQKHFGLTSQNERLACAEWILQWLEMLYNLNDGVVDFLAASYCSRFNNFNAVLQGLNDYHQQAGIFITKISSRLSL